MDGHSSGRRGGSSPLAGGCVLRLARRFFSQRQPWGCAVLNKSNTVLVLLHVHVHVQCVCVCVCVCHILLALVSCTHTLYLYIYMDMFVQVSAPGVSVLLS